MNTLTTLALYRHTVVTTDTISAESSVSRDLAYARRQLGNVDSVGELLANPRLLRIVTTAFGVSGYSGTDLGRSLGSEVVPAEGAALTRTITAGVNRVLGLEADGSVSLAGGLADVTSAADLLADDELAKVFVTAFGLQNYVGRPDFLARLLEQDTYDPSSDVRRLGDPDVLDAARTFQRIRLAVGDPQDDRETDLLRDVTNRYSTAMLLASGTPAAGSALEAYDDPALTAMAATLAFGAPGGPGLGDEATVEAILDRFVEALRVERQTEEDSKAVNYNRAVTAARQDAATKRDIEYFTSTIGTVASVDDLMKNDRLYRFVMEAFGLESQLSSRALIRKVLEGGVTDKNSVANRMNNRNFREMAATLRIAEDGGASLRDPAVVQGIVDRLVQVRMEKTAGQQNEGVRLALYFQRVAPTLNNWYDIMADQALSAVVRTALNLPDQVAGLDVDRQKALYEKKIAFNDLKDPEKMRSLVNRFAAMYEVKNGSAASTTSSLVTALFAPAGNRSIVAIDPSITAMLSRFPRF